MSQTNIPIIQLAQLGFADRLALEAQHPELARQAAQQAAPEALKQQKDTIGETESTNKARALKPEKDGKGAGGEGDGKKRRRKGESLPEDVESTPDSPWAGNILNLKV